MAYFQSKSKQTELFTDASPTGLSAILSQKTPGKEDRKIVAYVSTLDQSIFSTETKKKKKIRGEGKILWRHATAISFWFLGLTLTLTLTLVPWKD